MPEVHIDWTEFDGKKDRISGQCWIAFDSAEEALPHIADYIGHDRILWSTDYPHPDGLPNGTSYILRNSKLSDGSKRAILGGNAQAFLNFSRRLGN